MEERTQAWYRQGWPWVLILIPFSAVLFGIVMISTAAYFPDDLVADDYYKDGMAINRQIEMDERAREMGIVAHLRSLTGDTIEFDIEGASDSAVVLNIYHVTDRNQDQKILLVPASNGRYQSSDVVDVPFATQGVWYLELEGVDAHWRLRRRVVSPFDTLTMGVL